MKLFVFCNQIQGNVFIEQQGNIYGPMREICDMDSIMYISDIQWG